MSPTIRSGNDNEEEMNQRGYAAVINMDAHFHVENLTNAVEKNFEVGVDVFKPNDEEENGLCKITSESK
jgi:hypothetical protein